MGESGLLGLLRALNRAKDLREVGEAAVRYALSQVPGARSGLLVVLDASAGEFVPKAVVGRGFPVGSIPRRHAEALLGDRPVLLRPVPEALEGALGPFKSLLSFPILEGSEVIAYLLLGNREEPGALSPQDTGRVEPGWGEISTAVRRAFTCERLKEGEARLSGLLKLLPDAVVIADGKGLIRGWNRGAEELFGYSEEEVLGRPLTFLMAEEFRERHSQAFVRCAESGLRRKLIEGKGLRKDGSTFPIQWSLARHEEGGGVVFIAVGRDLSEKARMEEELRESERRFRMLFERLPDAVYITSFDGTILAANPEASRQTGYPLEELVGMNIMWDIAAEEPAITYEAVNERLRRGETVYFEERKRRKDGTVYWTECAVTQIEYQGQPATLSVNRDITGRKRLEEELQRHIRELEALNGALRSVVSALEIDEVLGRLAAIAGELVGAEYAVIATFDEEGDLRGIVDRPMGLGPLPAQMRPWGMTKRILATGEPVVVGEIRPDGSTVPPVPGPDGTPISANPALVEAGVRSFAGVPIGYGGKPVGILSVYSRKPHAFDERLPVLSSLADTAAIAIENARLYEETRHLFEESPVSLWVEDFSAIKERFDELRAQGVEDLKAYLRDHPEFVGECIGLLRVVEVNRTTLRLYRVEDLAELLERLTTLIPPEAGPLLEEELLAIWEGRAEFEGTGINRTADGDPIHIYIRWRVFPGHEEDYSRVLVSILDITERVRAEERLRDYVGKLAALHRAVWNLQRCRTVEEVCRAAVEGARGILGFSVCNIGLVQGDWVVPVYTVGDIRPRPFKRGEGLVWRTLEEGRSFRGNIQELPGTKPVDPRLRCAISVPIGDIGVFQAASFEPDAFDDDDVRLAEILAGHVSEEIRRVRLEEQLREQAIRDPLTGLYNRRHLAEVLKLEEQRARRYAHPFTVLVVDLDNFKMVNDRFGHPFGDEVLREVAGLLRRTVRESDLIFRYGGDEFVVLLPETDGQGRRVVARLRRALSRWARGKGLDAVGLGLSAGMAVWRPESPRPPEELLKEADRNLYRSKRRRKRS